MSEPKIILYHSHDIQVRNGKQYCVIKDKAGEEYGISEKRQNLWELFTNARQAEPFLLIYEVFNNISYIADAKPITDELLKRAIENMGLKLADAQTEERNRSTSLSYAKDLACAKIIGLDNLIEQAQKHYRFIKGL